MREALKVVETALQTQQGTSPAHKFKGWDLACLCKRFGEKENFGEPGSKPPNAVLSKSKALAG